MNQLRSMMYGLIVECKKMLMKEMMKVSEIKKKERKITGDPMN